ncbi:DUF2800 domain-containing protein [Paenibacillus humicus]|uniref:DUF2800 domain-containing protein n=1 Tax=Paenibacillus humicus TaxID=412861 RepID=UPI003F1672DB
MEQTHAMRAHAKLSASGSSRWLACPGSVQLESMFPETTSSYAEEGTAAHELAELHLQLYTGQLTKHQYEVKMGAYKKGNAYYSQEMEDYIQSYMDLVIERINDAKARSADAVVLLEHRLDFSRWVPEGFGTGDVLLISDGLVEVIDLKYGKGVAVSAVGNSQMRLYALGALNEFDMLYGIDRVRMTIVQPRLDEVSTDEMPAAELLEWAEQTVAPGAKQALSGKGAMKSGDHCKFCKARAVCRTRAMENLELAKFEFQDPPTLTVDEIAEVLEKAEQLATWAKHVQEHALEQAASHGVKFPGWKLVEGRSNRAYSDKDAIIDTLLVEGLDDDRIYKPRELLGIGDMEKSLGKTTFKKILGPYVVKPAGKPKLAPESDSRPELSSVSAAAADFSEDYEN